MDTESSFYYIFVDPINEKFPGFSKLIVKLKECIGNIKVINSIDEIVDESRTIPLGIVASHMFLKKYKTGTIAFIIDATTLGFLSVSKFYLRRKDFFNKNLIGSLLRYVKYYFIEKEVIKKYEKIIVVSQHDAEYLRRKFKSSNIFVVTNGVDIVLDNRISDKSFDYSLGILSYWGTNSLEDVKWFILEYLPRLRKIFPNIKLITAGRCAKAETINFFKDHNVEHMGELENLDDFFSRIDIYITTLRKECGILNKVLDSMAYKRIVVGYEHNMHAFSDLENGFFTYSDFNELVTAINTIVDDKELVDLKINNALNYLKERHNWQKNYFEFKALIDSTLK